MDSVKNLLPIGNTKNWGQQINRILLSLDDRLSSVEASLTNSEDSDIVANIGYAGSGVVTWDKIECTNNIISFQGTVYVAGPINKYYKNISIESSSTIENSYFNFVYLYYNAVEDSFEITIEPSLLYDYKHIVIGVLENATFTIKVWGSNKTSSQHRDEFYRRWIAKNDDNTVDAPVLSYTASGGLDFTLTNTGSYKMYVDGANTSTNTLENSTMNDYWIVNQNTTFYKIIGSDPVKNITFNQLGWYVGRWMLTNTGSSLMQWDITPLSNTAITPVSFNSGLISDLICSHYFENNLSNFLASDFVEMGRYAVYFNGTTIVSITSAQTNYFYVQTTSNGYMPQDQLSISKLNTDKLYINVISMVNQDESYGVKLSVENASTSSDKAIKFDAQGMIANSSLLTNNMSADYDVKWEFENIILDGTLFLRNGNTDILTVKNNVVTCIGDTDEATALQVSKGVTKFLNTEVADLTTKNISVTDGCNITFTSDRRAKTNIEKYNNSIIDVVCNTPVVTYNYLNSDKDQFGIIAQDLQNNLTKIESKYFIETVNDTDIPNKLVLKETKLVYILWKAIQELQAEIKELKKQ